MQQIFELNGKYFKTDGELLELYNYNRYLNFLNPDTFYREKGICILKKLEKRFEFI